MSERVEGAALGFDTPGTAEAYDRARPSYPAEAVAHVVGHGRIGPATRVLDLAAGTGKLTRLLVPTGAEVVAVEPVEAMRRRLVRLRPDVEVLDGTAENLPLPDESVDVVTVAQAFHWFDPRTALDEVHRVLRPGGRLFLVWNMRDLDHDWVRCFGDLLLDRDIERPYDRYYDVDYATVIAEADAAGRPDPDEADAGRPEPRFTPARMWSHRWEQPADEELLVARAASISVVGALDPGDRDAVLERVRHLARTHPDLAGRPSFGFPYVTRVWRCRAT